MKTRICVTVRMGWVEEIDTRESSMIQVKEDLQERLRVQVPPDGKLDIDVRRAK